MRLRMVFAGIQAICYGVPSDGTDRLFGLPSSWLAILYVCGAVLATVLAPTASATWGRHCSAGENHHCYGIAEWEMTGSGNGGGEEVKGISGEIATDAMSVPSGKAAMW
jgi:hypothetical protein